MSREKVAEDCAGAEHLLRCAYLSSGHSEVVEPELPCSTREVASDVVVAIVVIEMAEEVLLFAEMDFERVAVEERGC